MTLDELKKKCVDGGHEDAIVLENPSYCDSVIGFSADGRVVYDYTQMVFDLIDDEGMTEEEAVDWLQVNTLRAIPYMGPKAPIVVFPLEED